MLARTSSVFTQIFCGFPQYVQGDACMCVYCLLSTRNLILLDTSGLTSCKRDNVTQSVARGVTVG
jgi:hypothetical protein